MSTFTATASVPTENNGSFGTKQVPAFTVEASTVPEAADKVAAILTTTGGKAYAAVVSQETNLAWHFVAESGEAKNVHALPLV